MATPLPSDPVGIALDLVEYAIGVLVKEKGVDGARQTVADRIEIALARAAADAEAAARFGEVPPAG